MLANLTFYLPHDKSQNTIKKQLHLLHHHYSRKPRLTLASFTSRSFPMKFFRFNMETALRASHWVDISTKANPLGWPVCLSFTILTDITSPASEKRALSSGSLVCKGRLAI